VAFQIITIMADNTSEALLQEIQALRTEVQELSKKVEQLPDQALAIALAILGATTDEQEPLQRLHEAFRDNEVVRKFSDDTLMTLQNAQHYLAQRLSKFDWS